MKRCLSCQSTFSGTDWHCPACGHEPPIIHGFPAFAPDLAIDNNGIVPGAHHHLDQLQERSFWYRSRNRLILDLVRSFAPDAATLLEVGAGSGFVLSGLRTALPDCHFVASEIYSHGLPYAARRVPPPCEFIQADAHFLPYEEEFDAIGAFDVLEHIDNDEAVLVEMGRALKPHGILLLSVPQHPWLWSCTDETAYHRRRYRKGELAEKLEHTGYTVLRQTSFVFLLLPAMIAQRLLAGGRKNHPFGAELDLPNLIDRMFEVPLELERWLIRMGLNLPAGGSQVVVARKGRSVRQ
jgi:ubiquinone/menaquinone biosynthesis C-methylase UbiE